MNTKHDTRPTTARIHAELVACKAAARARGEGADETTCALIHAETYAAAMRER